MPKKQSYFSRVKGGADVVDQVVGGYLKKKSVNKKLKEYQDSNAQVKRAAKRKEDGTYDSNNLGHVLESGMAKGVQKQKKDRLQQAIDRKTVYSRIKGKIKKTVQDRKDVQQEWEKTRGTRHYESTSDVKKRMSRMSKK